MDYRIVVLVCFGVHALEFSLNTQPPKHGTSPSVFGLRLILSSLCRLALGRVQVGKILPHLVRRCVLLTVRLAQALVAALKQRFGAFILAKQDEAATPSAASASAVFGWSGDQAVRVTDSASRRSGSAAEARSVSVSSLPRSSSG